MTEQSSVSCSCSTEGFDVAVARFAPVLSSFSGPSSVSDSASVPEETDDIMSKRFVALYQFYGRIFSNFMAMNPCIAETEQKLEVDCLEALVASVFQAIDFLNRCGKEQETVSEEVEKVHFCNQDAEKRRRSSTSSSHQESFPNLQKQAEILNTSVDFLLFLLLMAKLQASLPDFRALLLSEMENKIAKVEDRCEKQREGAIWLEQREKEEVWRIILTLRDETFGDDSSGSQKNRQSSGNSTMSSSCATCATASGINNVGASGLWGGSSSRSSSRAATWGFYETSLEKNLLLEELNEEQEQQSEGTKRGGCGMNKRGHVGSNHGEADPYGGPLRRSQTEHNFQPLALTD